MWAERLWQIVMLALPPPHKPWFSGESIHPIIKHLSIQQSNDEIGSMLFTYVLNSSGKIYLYSMRHVSPFSETKLCIAEIEVKYIHQSFPYKNHVQVVCWIQQRNWSVICWVISISVLISTNSGNENPQEHVCGSTNSLWSQGTNL